MTITGSGFTGATLVDFGTVAASSFTVNSATADHGHEPGGHAGTVNVTVVDSGRHLGHLVGRSVHLHEGEGRQFVGGAFGRHYVGGDGTAAFRPNRTCGGCHGGLAWQCYTG